MYICVYIYIYICSKDPQPRVDSPTGISLSYLKRNSFDQFKHMFVSAYYLLKLLLIIRICFRGGSARPPQARPGVSELASSPQNMTESLILCCNRTCHII